MKESEGENLLLAERDQPRSVDNQIRYAVGKCTLGSVLVALSDRGICGISLGDDPDQMLGALRDRFPLAHLINDEARIGSEMAQVIALVEVSGTGLDLPLDVRGTAFQRRVWDALLRIPPGQTATYTEIARSIGAPRGARAVAQACAANTLAVAIPCHRVVRNDGSLSGFRWGVERKAQLLSKESSTELARPVSSVLMPSETSQAAHHPI